GRRSPAVPLLSERGAARYAVRRGETRELRPRFRRTVRMPDGFFSGLLVVDLTRVLAGPFCTMMLAELGARVIKVEDPRGGDDARRFEPFFEGQSAYFASLNRGKESIALDFKNDDDRAVFGKLVRRADVLVENFR